MKRKSIHFLIIIFVIIASVACKSDMENIESSAVSEEGFNASGGINTSDSDPTSENSATNIPSPTHIPDSTPTPTLSPTIEGPVTITVNTDGSGDYETLELAIESVALDSTIELSEGVFRLQEILELDKPLTLVGAGKEQTSIVSRDGNAVILYSGEGNLTVRDLTIYHDGNLAAEVLILQAAEADLSNCIIRGGIDSEDQVGAGLLLEDFSQVNVSNCEFVDNEGVGVLVRGDSQLDMKTSIVTRNGFGVAFVGNSSGQLVDNVIEKNNKNGVLVLEYATPLITSNRIMDNLESGISYNLNGEGGGLAEANELRGNNSEESFDAGTDIAILGSFAPDLIDNTCSGGEGITFNFGDNKMADQSGILFLVLGVAPPQVGSFTFKNNDCAYAYCGHEPGGNILPDLECFDLDESKISE